MPKAFGYRWTVRVGDTTHASGSYTDTCRDSAMVTLGNLFDMIAKARMTDAGRAFFLYPTDAKSPRRALVSNHHDLIQLEGVITHNASTPDAVVQRVIDLLQPIFPELTFKLNDTEDAVTGSVWPGIVISGNADVVEAWYWAGLLLRVSVVYKYDDPDLFESKLARHLGSASSDMYYSASDSDWHERRWATLKDNVVKPGWYLLIYGSGSGPRVASSYRGEIEAMIARVMYKPGQSPLFRV